jgi:Holliday junction DNA helicase RuvA
MIASLTGTVSQLHSGSLVLEVSGVGYLVAITSKTSKSLILNQQVKLHTSLIIREDAHSLFGFLSTEELEAFDLLRSVSGVGPKSALGVLTELSVDQIGNAVQAESDDVFRAVTGIGPKTAKLIVLTLAGKIMGDTALPSSNSSSETQAVVVALVGLGWSEPAAKNAVAQVAELASGRQEVLKLALKYLSSSSAKKGSGS